MQGLDDVGLVRTHGILITDRGDDGQQDAVDRHEISRIRMLTCDKKSTVVP